MNQKDIETLSINAVRDSIVASDFLDQFIADNDKEPSWDGFIYIYKDKSKKKNKLKGRIPVQVKGKINKDFSKKEITFPVSVDDLNNYLYDGGVIFFVVYVNSDDLTKKIYFSDLTPVKLRSLLEGINNKKTKTIRLKTFPTDGNKKATIVLNCYDHCQKQASFVSAELFSIEELESQGLVESIKGYISGYEISKDPIGALLTTDLYTYVQIKGSSIPQPIKDIGEKIKISKKIEAKITINKKVYYESFHLTKSTENNTIKIGESLTFIFDDDNNNKIEFKRTDKLKEAIKDLSFLLDCIEFGSFEIDGEKILFQLSNSDLSKIDVEEERKGLDYYLKAVRALELLNEDGDLDLSKMTERDWNNIDILITAFVDKKPVSDLKYGLPVVSTVKVCDYRFALVFLKHADKKDTYNIYDFFKIKLDTFYEDKTGESYSTSQYFILKTSDYLEISNIRLDKLLPSYQNINDDPYIFDKATKVLLDLVSAYDKSSSKIILLKTAYDFAEWLMSVPNEKLPYKIRILNKLQIIKRERELNIDEVKELCNLVEDSFSTEEELIGAYLLLDNKTAAHMHYQKLEPNPQKIFDTYPISYFWNNDPKH